MTHQPAFDPLPKMDGDSDKNLSRFLPVGGGTQSLSVPNEVGIQDLAHNLVPGGIPFFFLLLHRYMKKHSSYKTRAAIIGLGAGLYLSRRWRGYLGHLVQQYFLCTAEVREGDEGYDMLLSWISHQRFAKTSRSFVAAVSNEKRDFIYRMMARRSPYGSEEPIKQDAYKYTPAYGTYPFWYKSNLYFFTRTPKNDRGTADYISISCLGRNPNTLKKILDECREDFNEQDKGKTVIYTAADSHYEAHWIRGIARTSRPFSTVVLDDNIKNDIVKDLEIYLSAKQQKWYADRGIPYRRGYLLHGPPGTGKSSLSFAIAGHFKMNIYIISLNNPKITEELLASLFTILPSKCLVLMEDIDAAGMTRDRNSDDLSFSVGEGKISLSSLLNVLDGVASQEGRVLIMTTNHIENLDPALIRPGRIDMMIKFSNAEKPQLAQIFKGIYVEYATDLELKTENDSEESTPVDPELEALKAAAKKAHEEKISSLAEQFSEAVPGGAFSPAEIQGYLLKHKDSPETAVQKAGEWSAEVIAARAAAVAAKQAKKEAAELKEATKTAKANAQALQGMMAQGQAMGMTGMPGPGMSMAMRKMYGKRQKQMMSMGKKAGKSTIDCAGGSEQNDATGNEGSASNGSSFSSFVDLGEDTDESEQEKDENFTDAAEDLKGKDV